jgi:alkaline phosphatase D
MNLRLAALLTSLLGLLLSACASQTPGAEAPPPPVTEQQESRWTSSVDRVWVGEEYWANRLQDWCVREGRLHCRESGLPMRTLHLLTRRISERPEPFHSQVRLGFETGSDTGEGGAITPAAGAGFLLGAGAAELDHRAACLVQSAPGPDGGWLAGIDGEGRLFIRDNSVVAAKDGGLVRGEASLPLDDIELRVTIETGGDGRATIELTALDPVGERELEGVRRGGIEPRELAGNVALFADAARGQKAPRGAAVRFWFDRWVVDGARLDIREERKVGAILSAQHTLSRDVMKMCVQLMPIGEEDGRELRLETRIGARWREVARASVITPGFTAVFRVPDWPSHRNVRYRILYPTPGRDGRWREYEWSGQVQRDPVDDDEFVLAAFTGNHNNRHGFGRTGYPWNAGTLWFPHEELVGNVGKHQPDLLFFSGDQIYEGQSPTRAEKRVDRELDYLYKWYLWCWAWREVTRNVACITIPDDHDVYQGNLWGAGGRSATVDNRGGYVMPAEWVQMVERTQTSNLPDPARSAPIEQGLTTYYTSLRSGGIDFAILEDRKFKSGCAGLVEHGGPRPDHITDPDFDPRRADVAGAQLLGPDQLDFLERWALDWKGVTMKAALSQTVFANVATRHGSRLSPLVADLDSNGWPQSGRNRALAALRLSSAFMVGGDQHLATIVHHGIEEWDDAGWSFCVPSIANFYPRAWRPAGRGEEHQAGLPDYTGRYLDGFGNHITVWAATNPDGPTGREPAALHDGMPGYGIIRFDKPAGEITMECWPRAAHPITDEQYAGWPRTVGQYDNDGREVTAWLPRISVRGVDHPTVLLHDEESGELVYARRLRGGEIRLGVFERGRYSVVVGEPETERWQLLLELDTEDADGDPIVVRFR